jgi:hypothetical protein
MKANIKMTKEITAEQLIEVLKFTPRTYSVSMYGYGGEIAMGTVDRATFDYIKSRNVDLDELVNDYDNELEVPEEYRFVSDGSWYDCDDMCHESGVEFGDGCYISVLDENGDEVWTSSLEPSALEDAGCSVSEWEEVYAHTKPKGTVVFMGQSIEKGTFFGGEFHLKEPFDPSKLSFSYGDYEGWRLGASVEYDGEAVENNDYSTTGKSLEFRLFEVLGDGEIEHYEPQELPEGEENGGAGWPGNYNPEQSEEVTFKFKKHKPVHAGWYTANWSYGTTFGKLYWNGTEFVDFMYNKPQAIDQKGIVSWTGLNWDTNSWDNCPQPKDDLTGETVASKTDWPF